jgi:RNA recognition motif-containing protein
MVSVVSASPSDFIYGVALFLTGILVGRLFPRLGATASEGGGPNEIYVGNLSYETGKRELMQVFEKYGKVRSARIIKHKFSGKSKGFGFVQMRTRADTQSAIRALSGSDLNGRRIVVNEAKSRARDDE